MTAAPTDPKHTAQATLDSGKREDAAFTSTATDQNQTELATLKRASTCRRAARSGVFLWGTVYYIFLIGTPAVSVLLTGLAAYYNVDIAALDRAGSAPETPHKLPVAILVVSGLVSLLTLLAPLLKPVGSYTRHLLFRNRFDLFIDTFREERALLLLKFKDPATVEPVLTRWRIWKAQELTQITDAWDTDAEKPPGYAAFDAKRFADDGNS